MSVSVYFVPNVVVQHVNCFVVCCIKTERSILLMGDVAYDARFSDAISVIICHLVTSPFKTMYFQTFWQKLLS